MMAETLPRIDFFQNIAEKLALTEVDEHTGIGWYQSFPIALSLVPLESKVDQVGNFYITHLSVTLQIRYIGLPEDYQKTEAAITDPAVKEIIQLRKLKIEFDDTIAYLTTFETDSTFLESEFEQCLDAMINAVKSDGATANNYTCHYCNNIHVPELTWIEARVAQICTDCLKAKLEEVRLEKKPTVSGSLTTMLTGIAAAAIGGILWALLWWIDGLVIAWLAPGRSTEIQVPHFYLIAEVFTLAILTGIPIGLIVTIAKRAGQRIPVFVAIVAAIIAAIIGDCTTILRDLSEVVPPLSFTEAFDLLPVYWETLGTDNGFHFAALFLGIVVAAITASIRTSSN